MHSFLLPDQQAYLRYLDLPGRDPVRVYLHGLASASSLEFPETVAEPPLAGFRSLLVDFLGHGYSDRPVDFGYTLEEQALTIAALLDGLALKGCAIIGHSMGGAIAITLSALRPDLVSILVVAEPNLDPGGGALSKPIAQQTEEDFVGSGYDGQWRRLQNRAALRPGLLAHLAAWRAASPLALHRSSLSLVRGTQPSLRERFLSSPIPRAYLYGEHSKRSLALTLPPSPGLEVLTVPGAGHNMMSDNPSGFADAVAKALGKESEDGRP